MYKILNRADFWGCDKLKKSMDKYSNKYGFNGYELIKFTDNDESQLKDYFKGYHIRFFPSWMEFYKEDFTALYKELKDKKYFKSLCGGENSKDELINYLKKELEIAKKLEVEYVVFHACNIKITESLTYIFNYSDMEVLKNVVDILNEIFEGGNYSFKLLLENLWWPGLRLTNKEEIKYLLENINYKNMGFVLDTGHMINNNLEIKNSQEAVNYIKENLKNIGEYKKYILGMHLNYSLSGSYVKKVIEENRKKDLDIHDCMKTVYEHINYIDYHDPFENEEIIEIIRSLPIKYLVYEFIGMTEAELENKIERQDKILKKLLGGINMDKIIAIPTKDGLTVEKHFGHADKFAVYKIEAGKILEKSILNAPEKAHGVFAKFLKEKAVNVVITNHMSSKVFEDSKANGIEFILGAEGEIEILINEYLSGKLECKGMDHVHQYTDHSHCCSCTKK